MRDEFYIVLPSNSSTYVFPENTPTHFTTQLPQNLWLYGEWCVALCEIQFPLTLQHISLKKKEEGRVLFKKFTKNIHSNNELRDESPLESVGYVPPGVYENIESLLREINNLFEIKDHLHFKIQSGGFAEISRICVNSCAESVHSLVLSEKLQRIFGFDNASLSFTDENPILGSRPANLINGLPAAVMVYTNICEPYVTGDIYTRLLRAVPLNLHAYKYGGIEIKNFSSPMYIPLLFSSFQSIEIDIKDEQGNPITVDYGVSSVTLHFKRVG